MKHVDSAHLWPDKLVRISDIVLPIVYRCQWPDSRAPATRILARLQRVHRCLFRGNR